MSSFSKYLVGGAQVTRLFETSIDIPPERLYVNWDDNNPDYRKWFSGKENEGLNPATLSVHTWIVEWRGKIVLVDTGVGNGKERSFSPAFHHLNTRYIEDLGRLGVRPEQVDLVLLTHLHTDHIGWNTFHDGVRWVPTFPNARYIFPQAELDFFKTPAAESRLVIFDDSVRPVIESGNYTTVPEAGGTIDGFTFHPTPGHSVGHMSISFRDEKETALFTGDVAHNPVQVENPELASIFCADPEKARLSRLWVLEHGADQDATLFTAHFSQSSAGKVVRTPTGYSWSFV